MDGCAKHLKPLFMESLKKRFLYGLFSGYHLKQRFRYAKKARAGIYPARVRKGKT
jgi:hypothetical protein